MPTTMFDIHGNHLSFCGAQPSSYSLTITHTHTHKLLTTIHLHPQKTAQLRERTATLKQTHLISAPVNYVNYMLANEFCILPTHLRVQGNELV